MNRLAIVGLTAALAGLVLALGFGPLTTVSGADILASWNAGRPQYAGHAPGARIAIHERVLNVHYSNSFFGSPVTTLELEDGDPGPTTEIYVRGDATGLVKGGDVILASAVLQVIQSVSFYYWEVASPADVHQSWPVDAAFYGLMAVGVAALAYAALRRP